MWMDMYTLSRIVVWFETFSACLRGSLDAPPICMRKPSDVGIANARNKIYSSVCQACEKNFDKV
jgi:hypothetical protein